MKIVKTLMLLYLLFLIYFFLTIHIANIILYIAFISVIVLGFKSFKIDNVSQYIKNSLYENIYIKKNFNLNYILFNTAIIMSPFIFRFIIQTDYNILASIIYFIVVFCLYSKIKNNIRCNSCS
ncbi:hypothetical protein C3I13_06575 [Campylobacter jejuni]|nr:hypothetical protein C3I13_06575 [Campylobacter jejuni]RTI67174.1 hypothetical protein C3I14_07060 [Campylobacter jejuni]